jgi:hypothetical protein
MLALETTTFIQHTLAFPARIREDVAEMSRLINAALVDSSFCSLLLYKPAQALKQGYLGEVFNLSELETQFVIQARANSLTDFAMRWSNYSKDMVSTAKFIDIMLPNRKLEC